MIPIFKKNIIYIYIYIIFLLNFFPSYSYSSDDVVYINLNKIMNNSIVGKYINTIIDNEKKKYQKNLQAKKKN